LSFWIRVEGKTERRTLIDSNYKLDVLYKDTWNSRGYSDYWNYGGDMSVLSDPIDPKDMGLGEWEWVFNVQTYNRTTDTATFYSNGIFQGNATNNQGDPNWASGDKATKFGYFGKVSDEDSNGIVAISFGSLAIKNQDSYTIRGGVDDFCIYNGVLSDAEQKALYEDTSPFDPSADDRLALYYDFNDPTSNTVLNMAPSTIGLYPMILGATRLTVEAMSVPGYAADTCTVVEHLPPKFNCHSYSICPDIPGPSHPPIAYSEPPKLRCTLDSYIVFPPYRFAYDPDGQELKYQVRTLPKHGILYEENQKDRLPEALHQSTTILSTALPFNQSEFTSPFFRYEHTPADPLDVKTSDSFIVAYSDGTNWTEVTISLEIMVFNKLPVATNQTTNLTVPEDGTVVQKLSFIDHDSSYVSIVAKVLPSHGIITYDSGSESKELEPFNEFNPYGDQIAIVQYAKEVVAFSSAWYNIEGNWAPLQILGEKSVNQYSDSPLTFCPASKYGTGISTNDNNETGREDYWDRDAMFAEFGYTEYIEVEFETPVYVSDIEIGENRGCGSIVRVFAKNSDFDSSMAIFDERVDTDCDSEDGQARISGLMNLFTPPQLCNSPYLVNRIRIEMDTFSVVDWNELDYVKLTGYKEPPAGIIPTGISQITFTPDPDFFGDDRFAFYATDCGYHSATMGEEAEFLIDVQAVADAPLVARIFLQAAPGNSSSTIDLSTSVQNLDNSDLTVKIIASPTVGSLTSIVSGEASGEAVTAGTTYDLNTTFVYSVASFPEIDTVVLIEYEVADASQSLSSREFIEIAVQGVPVEQGVQWEIIIPLLAVVTLTGVGVTGVLQRKNMAQKQEIEELANKLSMLQQYDENEKKMIEEQIVTFRRNVKDAKASTGTTDASEVDDALQKILINAQDLVTEERVGKGSFGEVFKASYRGSAVAVKTMTTVEMSSLDRFREEILLMADLRHPNIVSMIGACWEQDLMALVMEYCARGTATDVLKQNGEDFTWDDPLFKWVLDTSRALGYLHSVVYFDTKSQKSVNGIVHRDMKPDNCLITETFSVKIGDFGESKAILEDETMTQVGTPLFVAPEVVMGEQYDSKCDIYSLAMTILSFALKGEQLLTNFLHMAWVASFGENSDQGAKAAALSVNAGRISHKMINNQWRPSFKFITEELQMPQTIASLLLLCWDQDPTKRPTAREITEYLENDSSKTNIEGFTTTDSPTGRKLVRKTSTSGTLLMRIATRKRELEEEEMSSKGNNKVGRVTSRMNTDSFAAQHGLKLKDLREENEQLLKRNEELERRWMRFQESERAHLPGTPDS